MVLSPPIELKINSRTVKVERKIKMDENKAAKKKRKMPEVITPRSIGMWQVATFWAVNSEEGVPPAEYGDITQKEAFMQHYDAVGDSREKKVYRTSIRNAWETVITWSHEELGLTLQNPKHGWLSTATQKVKVPTPAQMAVLDFLCLTRKEQWKILNECRNGAPIAGTEDEKETKDADAKDEKVVVLLTEGRLSRLPLADYQEDAVQSDAEAQIVKAFARELLLFFTTAGYMHIRRAGKIPQSGKSGGILIGKLLGLSEGETVTNMIHLDSLEDGCVLMVTQHGWVKRLGIPDVQENNQLLVTKLEKGEQVHSVLPSPNDESEIRLLTKDGDGVQCSGKAFPIVGPATRGTELLVIDEEDTLVQVRLVKSEPEPTREEVRRFLRDRSPDKGSAEPIRDPEPSLSQTLEMLLAFRDVLRALEASI